MKNLLLLLIPLLLLQLNFTSSSAQVSEAHFNNLPEGENIIIEGDVGGYSVLTDHIIVTNRFVYLDDFDEYDVQFYAPYGTEIVDARFKLSFAYNPPFLVLLNNGRIIELRWNSAVHRYTIQIERDPIPVGGDSTYFRKILGDDLYAMKDHSVYVSDSGYNWVIDTAGLNNPVMINDIDIDTTQKVWLCASNGLYTQDLNVTIWSENVNYPGINPKKIFIDRSQNVWVAEYFGNLYVSTDGGSSFQIAPSGLSSASIQDICDDAFGNIYVMSYYNLYYSQGGTQPFVQIDQTVIDDFDLLEFPYVYNNISGDTLLYLATDAGEYTTDDQGATWIYDGAVSAEHIGYVGSTSDDRLLMSSNTGLHRLEADDSTWTKLYPQNGFLWGTEVFTASNGDIYLLAESVGNNSGYGSIKMVYKSTDNGNNFALDTSGIIAGDVGNSYFLVDENGVQHAGSRVNIAGTYYARAWKKEPGQDWALDTTGLGTLMTDFSPRSFGTDHNGKIYFAIYDYANSSTTIYSRPIAGGTWTAETTVNGEVYNIKGRNGIVIAGTKLGMMYNNGGGWQTAPLPSAVTGTITNVATEVDINGIAWAFFKDVDGTNIPVGKGIFYTTDFSNWLVPAGNVDTVLFSRLVAIGDSVFALASGFEGVYVFDTTAALPEGIAEIESINKIRIIPNPFHNETILQFDLENDSRVELIIYNVLGEIVFEIPSQQMNGGTHQLKISLPDFVNGVLMFELRVNGKVEMGKMVKE